MSIHLSLGSKSTVKKITISGELPNELNLENLVQWLEGLTQYKHEIFKLKKELQRLNSINAWARASWATFLILLENMNIPYFDAIKINNYPKSEYSRHYVINCEIIDRGLFENSKAFSLVQYAFDLAIKLNDIDFLLEDQREELFHQISHTLKICFHTMIWRGKSTYQVLYKAHQDGVPYLFLPGGVVQLGRGKRSTFIDRSTTLRDSAIGKGLAGDKAHTAALLKLAGLPSADHRIVSSLSEALDACGHLNFPVVVKPSDAERGEGVHVDVTLSNLSFCFEDAFKKSRRKKVLIERQVSGVCHRVFVIKSKVLYAFKRLPVGVYGDGEASIEELVNQEWDKQKKLAPWKRSGVRPIKELDYGILNTYGHTAATIPSRNVFIPLRRIESTAMGGTFEEVTYTMHEDNKRLAIKAAQLFGLEVCGVDIISEDITLPWYSSDLIINEVNYAPSLGGTDISRKYISDYIKILLGGDGRIPVYVFVGGEKAWKLALQKQRTLNDEFNENAYLTNGEKTLDHEGREARYKDLEFKKIVEMIYLDRKVSAIVVVADTKESIRALLKIDNIRNINILDIEQISGFKNDKEQILLLIQCLTSLG